MYNAEAARDKAIHEILGVSMDQATETLKASDQLLSAAAKAKPSQDVTETGNGKYAVDNYPTDGVHWIYEIDGVDSGDARFVWEVISNITKRG